MTGGRLGEIGESIGGALLRRAGRVAARIQERSGLDADLLEDDDAYLVVFDAPGANRSDVQVRYDDGAVSVRVDRFRSFHEGYEMSIPGRGLSLDGRVELPSRAVDPAAATAVLTDRGTLEVTVPKTEDAPERSEVEDAAVDADADDVETVDRTEDDTDFEFGPDEEEDGDDDPIDLTEVDDDHEDDVTDADEDEDAAEDDEAADGGETAGDRGDHDGHDGHDGHDDQSGGEESDDDASDDDGDDEGDEDDE